MKHPYPLWHPVYWLSTWFHVGLIPKAPGTFGTLAAIPFAGYLYHHFGMNGLALATVLCTLVGVWVSSAYVKTTGREDPKEVVIDEVAGFWLTCLLAIDVFHHMSNVLAVVILFASFRLFDITKPWPISVADSKVKGGFGIMIDDLLAALYAAALVHLLLWGMNHV